MGKEMSASNIQLFSKLLTLVFCVTVYVVPETSKEHDAFIFKRSGSISWWTLNPLTSTAPTTHPVMWSHITKHQKH